MKKLDDQQLPVVQPHSGTFPRRRCAGGIWRLVNFKCAVVLTLGAAALISALLYVLPYLHRHAGFDANESIKLSATVQACFRLHKPVSELVPHIARLEYDLNGEIGVPSSKVAILSMHQDGKSNWSSVVFGFLPDPIDIALNPVFLSGITMIPERVAFILHVPEALFHFTLNNSVHDLKDNILELKQQLKLGLHLMPNEEVCIQVTNNRGSTKDPPVTIEASVVSGEAILTIERLKELAQIITSPAENLGLDHSVFGKVKEISLSSFLNRSLHAQAPIPSPSPSPAPSPSSLPDFSNSVPPCPNCYASAPSNAGETFPPSPHNSPRADSPESPLPSPTSYSNRISPSSSSPAGSAPQVSPIDPYNPWWPVERNTKNSVSSPSSSSPSWSCTSKMQWSFLTGHVAFLLGIWIS